MTISVNMQRAVRAESVTLETSHKFDVVSIGDAGGNEVKLYLPHGTGPAIAHLITAAAEMGSGQ